MTSYGRSEEQRQKEYSAMLDAIQNYYDPLHPLKVFLECQTCEWKDHLLIVVRSKESKERWKPHEKKRSATLEGKNKT